MHSGIGVGRVGAAALGVCLLVASGEACGSGGCGDARHGAGPPHTARRDTAAEGYIAVAVGAGTLCAARAAGDVVCWGQGLAAGGTRVEGVTGARGVVVAGAAGQGFCAHTRTGDTPCWSFRDGRAVVEPGAAGPPGPEAPLDGLAASRFSLCGLRGGAVACVQPPRLEPGHGPRGGEQDPVALPGRARALRSLTDAVCAIGDEGVVCYAPGGDEGEAPEVELQIGDRGIRDIGGSVDSHCVLDAQGVRCASRTGAARFSDAPMPAPDLAIPELGTGDRLGVGYGLLCVARAAEVVCVLGGPDAGARAPEDVLRVPARGAVRDLAVFGATACFVDDAGPACVGLRGEASPLPPAAGQPVRVALGAPAVDVAAARGTTCAVTDGGTVACWGEGDGSAHGVRLGGPLHAPRRVDFVEGVRRVRLRSTRAIGFGTAGVFLWGGGVPMDPGLAIAPTRLRDVPTDHAWFDAREQVIVHDSGGRLPAARCAVRYLAGAAPEPRCEPLAPSDADAFAALPARDGPIKEVVSGLRTCVSLADGELRCRDARNALVPVPAARPPTEDGIAASVAGCEGAACGTLGAVARFDDTCAVLRDGGLACWGPGAHRVLGLALADDARGLPRTLQLPVRHPDVTDAVDFCQGARFACVARRGGGARCWPVPSADGEGPPEAVVDAAVMARLQGVRRVACGSHHACALDGDGAVHCWGAVDDGRLGDPAASIVREPWRP